MVEEDDVPETFLPLAKNIRTKGDRARAAAKVAEFSKIHGVPDAEIKRGKHHEYTHAKADDGEEGEMGAVMKGHKVVGAYYRPVGERTHLQRLKIQIAPGDDMSESDKKRAARSVLGIIAGWFGIKIE